MMIDIEKKNGWIKYSEKLPKNGEWVLVTFFHNVYFGKKTKNGWLIDTVEDCDLADENDVLAWQPLPEPYKEQNNSNWIKISKSTPKFADWVLVTLKCGKLCFGYKGHFNKELGICDWTIAYDFPYYSHITGISGDKILAWQPLPKPYKI